MNLATLATVTRVSGIPGSLRNRERERDRKRQIKIIKERERVLMRIWEIKRERERGCEKCKFYRNTESSRKGQIKRKRVKSVYEMEHVKKRENDAKPFCLFCSHSLFFLLLTFFFISPSISLFLLLSFFSISFPFPFLFLSLFLRFAFFPSSAYLAHNSLPIRQ